MVSGHKDRTLPDDPSTIEDTRRYLSDAERLIATSDTALEFFRAMLDLYPQRLNPGALWSGAQAIFGS